MLKYTFSFLLSSLICVVVSSQVINTELHQVMHQRQLLKKEAVRHLETSLHSYETLKSSSQPKFKLDSLIEYNQNSETEQWDKKFTKETFHYNEDHNEVLWIYSSWSDKANEWYDLMKEESDYYSDGKLKGFTNYVWGANDKWNGFVKEVYQYDELYRLQETTHYSWKNSIQNWMATSVTKYSYNNDNSLSKDSTYNWVTALEDWSIQSKNEYTYIHGGLIHHIYNSEYNTTNDLWELNEDTWYLYDNIKWLLHSITVYEFHNDKWLRKQMDGMTYDDDDWLNGNGVVKWNITGEEPELTNMTNCYYDYDFNTKLEDLIMPSYLTNNYPQFFHHQVIGRRLYQNELETNTRYQYRSIKYYYSNTDEATNINNSQMNSFKLYPNPATDFVYLNSVDINQPVQFQLFDIMGSKIIGVQVSATGQVDVSAILPGVYLYVIYQGNKKETGKIIIN